MNPAGGNIDTVAVGPGGVVVLDAKAWNGHLEVTATAFKVGGYSKARDLDKVKEQALTVQRLLADEVAVSCGLVFPTQPAFAPRRVADVTLTGTDHLVPGMRAMPDVLTTAMIERLLRTISELLPPAGTAPSAASGQAVVDPIEATRNFERLNRPYYVAAWRSGGRHRLYLRDEAGTTLGFRDVIADTVTLEPTTDDPFVRPLLEAVTPAALPIGAKSLPKVKVKMPAGRLLGVLGKLWVNALVGQEWRKGSQHRLYGTLANPTEGVFKLGYVDLNTGWIKSDYPDRISDSLQNGERYLVHLRDRYPTTHARKA